jgi:signal transduction histidine kinase/ActR/RegA family two-component response regulator
MQNRPFKLQFLLAASITLLALVITSVVSFTIGRSGLERLERSIGQSLAMLADQMQDKLDRGLFERIREINNIAGILASGDQRPPPAIVRPWFEQMQMTLPDYVWIGVADASGRVTASAQGVFEDASVAQDSWFKAGLKGAVFGDVHSPGSLAAKIAAARDGEATRLIAVAAPVNVKGQIAGVVGAQLSWNWAKEVQDSLFGSVSGHVGIEALVLSADGTVLLGPPEVIGKPLALESISAQTQTVGQRRFAVETWPDGQGYLSGFAEDVEYPLFGGLGWRILVRQKAALALAPVVSLRQQILLWSAAFVALSAFLAWFLAGRLAAPLLRLATAADQLRRGERVEIPHVGAYAEAEILANSLRTLVDELSHRETNLQELNASLERQVADRTRRLEKRNLQLAAAKERAEEATASKSRFLAAASHDLRQPLHALTLFARALSRRVEGKEARDLVAQTEQALGSLKEMFDALLDISRLDAGLIEPTPQNISLSEFVERVSSGFQAEADHRGLSFRSRRIDAVVRTDPALLETIMRNLLSNAMKFTRRGGIMLACRRVEGRIAIEVYDTGVGIREETGNHIFQEFSRSKFAASGANDGLGLGLSIVKRYADLLGISVRFQSRHGRGTKFALVLPASAEVSCDAARPAIPLSPCSLEGRRILVLDDEPLIVESLARDLTDRGAVVFKAGDVGQGEAQLRSVGVEVAVIDINLDHGETGPEFIDRMERELGRSLPSLVLTGATDADTLSGLVLNGRRWMTKPADPDTIARVLSELLVASAKAKAAPKVHEGTTAGQPRTPVWMPMPGSGPPPAEAAE